LCQLREKDGPIREALGWYAHIIVDEGQDLSLLELEAILAATDKRNSITLSADSRQKILSWVDGADFDIFRNNLKEVGVSNETLSVSYRCPTEIMALAARISNRESEQIGRHSGVLEYHKAADEESALAQLRRLVEQLVNEDPHSLTAVICKKKSDEKMLHKALTGITGLHQQGELTFEPGVLVTIAHQVEGGGFQGVGVKPDLVDGVRAPGLQGSGRSPLGSAGRRAGVRRVTGHFCWAACGAIADPATAGVSRRQHTHREGEAGT